MSQVPLIYNCGSGLKIIPRTICYLVSKIYRIVCVFGRDSDKREERDGGRETDGGGVDREGGRE